MKKFILKLLAYAAIISSLTARINAYYIMNTENDSEIKGVPQLIQICNFGSSHGLNSFNYEDAGEKFVCFNFALSSQPLLYDYRVLQHYRNMIKPGATVFIVISYFSFFGKPEVESDSFLARNMRYYKFLPSELIIAYDWTTDMYINYLPALSPEGLAATIKLLFGVAKKDDTKKNDNDNDYWDRTTDAEYVASDAIKAYRRHIAVQRDENGVRMRRKESFESLYGIIELCREIGARPMLVITPYLLEYTDAVRKNDPEFFRDFYSVIEEIRQKTGLEYYDYAFDERFCRDYSLFMNADHLNRKGARKFTDILLLEALSIDVMPPE